jgi:2',3'-cyclic-nucleotide 2'-phosphodiesterase (5'-nucleotidase family)
MARWASLVEKRRSERPVLMIDGGDFSLPPGTRQRDLKESSFFEAMKLSRYDAICIGEGEARTGIEERLAVAKRYGLPIVNTNILDRGSQKPVADESIVRDLGRSRAVFGRGRAVRVGIFSVVPQAFVYRGAAEDRAKYSVVDPKLSALAAAANLRREGCDLVIAVSNLGWQKSRELARDVPGIDLVLNGRRVHKKPCAERVGTTYVVDAGEKESTFAEISVTFEGDSIRAAVADGCPAARALPEDRRLARLQKKYAAEIERSVIRARKRPNR